ncbi:MAG: myo-inosose-2 dehydratase [Rhodospirillales bacterium]|jgi:inosose dehydratase|nr:myo-inosose-2 dehydratase [Rhodospirillales bacterium]
MSVQIGINPLTWTNDDMPELGGDTPLEVCLSETAAAGYAGIELGNKFPRVSSELRPILQAHRLELISGWYSGELLSRSVADEKAAVEDHLTLLADMGCSVMVFAEVTGCIHGSKGTPLSTRPHVPDGEWAQYGQRLTEMGKYLAGRGVAMAFHHHMGTAVQSAQDVDRLMENTGDEVGLLLDTGHLAYGGGDPVAAARTYAARINHVHCKDTRKDVLTRSLETDAGFMDSVLEGVFTVPGDGFIDYPGVFEALRSAGYAGWLVVEAEQDPAIAIPLTYAKMGYDYLREKSVAAGLAA